MWILLLTTLTGLFWFSMYLAAMRIYQVDECMEVYVARVLATAQDKDVAGHVTFMQVLLSWVLPKTASSVDLFASARLVMLLLFWSNWILIATVSGARLLSRRWFLALLGAATLVPLWDYGFEVRHDNLLLTGILLMWAFVRFSPASPKSCFMLGVIAAGLEFVAFKAFLYTLPLSVATLAFAPPVGTRSRGKLALSWMAGALTAFSIVYVTFRMAGFWDLYLGGVHFLSAASTNGHRFAPWKTLARLLSQTPLLLALVVSALVAVVVELARRGRAALTWNGNLPEALLFLGAFAVLLINPAPYPYNLLHLVPFAFLFAFRYGVAVIEPMSSQAFLIPLSVAIVLFTHLVPFGMAVRRHLDWPHTDQERLMKLAERLTDPVKDPVYDAVGMVPTRPIIDKRAFLHSLNFEEFVNGPGPQVWEMLNARAAAVFIPNYRTDWLPEKDRAFIREHYVPLADDIWVLGKVLSAGGGTFKIIHAGRYRISSLEGSDLMGTYPGGWQELLTPEQDGSLSCTLDGVPRLAGVVELTVGTHQIETSADCQPAVVWVGPQLDRVHRVSQRDHRRIFFNWY